jgi:hypothetical protein
MRRRALSVAIAALVVAPRPGEPTTATYCATCQPADGKGDRVVSRSLAKPPPDLTRRAVDWRPIRPKPLIVIGTAPVYFVWTEMM